MFKKIAATIRKAFTSEATVTYVRYGEMPPSAVKAIDEAFAAVDRAFAEVDKQLRNRP